MSIKRVAVVVKQIKDPSKYPKLKRDEFFDSLIDSFVSLEIFDPDDIELRGSILEYQSVINIPNLSPIPVHFLIDLEEYYTCYYNRIIQSGYRDSVSFGISCLELNHTYNKLINGLFDQKDKGGSLFC